MLNQIKIYNNNNKIYIQKKKKRKEKRNVHGAASISFVPTDWTQSHSPHAEPKKKRKNMALPWPPPPAQSPAAAFSGAWTGIPPSASPSPPPPLSSSSALPQHPRRDHPATYMPESLPAATDTELLKAPDADEAELVPLPTRTATSLPYSLQPPRGPPFPSHSALCSHHGPPSPPLLLKACPLSQSQFFSLIQSPPQRSSSTRRNH
ncbi:hypothetical protein VPH35_083872 [Triticum aestivum]